MCFRILTLLFICLNVSGCVSKEREVIIVSPEQSNEQLFDCINKMVSELGTNWQSKKIFEKNLELGQLDIGNYKSSEDILGFRLKATRTDKYLTLNLKGIGLYYTDPGADREMRTLKKGIMSCIEASPHKT